MHLVRLSAFLLPILLFLISCQGPEMNKNEDIFSVMGIMPDSEDTLVSLNIKDTTYKTTIINDTFRFEISLEEKATGSLIVDDRFQRIFAQNGQSIVINLSEEKASFEGSLAPIYYEYQELLDQYVDDRLPESFKEKFSLTQDSFTHLVYTGIQLIEEDIDTSLDESNEDWGYLMWAELTTNWAYYTLMYPVMYPRYTEDTTYSVTYDYYEQVIDEFNIDDVTLLRSSSREDLIKSAVENWTRVDTPYIESDSSRILFMFNIADNMFEQDSLSNIAKYHIVLDQLKYQGFGNAEPLIKEFSGSVKNTRKRREMSEMINKWMQLQVGNKAPDFIAQTPDTTQISLSDLEGSVVYIDVWATWCGPCLQEVPHLEEMHDHYSETKDLQIISVSIDSDYQKWYDMVTNKEMEGLQLWTKNAWESQLNEKYLIKSIPRFILIDKDGNIVDADAPRPSSKEEIYSMIDEELNKKG